jgi:hypothetical protein
MAAKRGSMTKARTVGPGAKENSTQRVREHKSITKEGGVTVIEKVVRFKRIITPGMFRRRFNLPDNAKVVMSYGYNDLVFDQGEDLENIIVYWDKIYK